jgi:hypothetical protein
MIHTIAFTLLFGQPLVLYGGILTLLMLLFTATVGLLNYKGITIVPFKWHPRLALATIIVAVIHAILGLSIFYNF